MNGVIVLQGGGPFVRNDTVDANVLSGLDGYVAIMPTALCDPMVDPRGGAYTLGLGLVGDLALITESETWSPERLTRSRSLANVSVVELPTGAAIMRQQNEWSLVGDVVAHGTLPVLV